MGNTLNSTLHIPSNIDLVRAVQAEYDFLRLVDKYPALSSDRLLQNAVYRYETYWLPLVAKFKMCLPAPLDIEWVWHCHILNVNAYKEDCINLIGKVIDHRPMMLVEASRELSRKHWRSEYKDIPFDVDFTNDEPTLISEEKPKCSYDIIDAVKKHKEFNYNTSLPHFKDAKFIKNAIKRYMIMLVIKKDNPSTFFTPSYDIDLVWRTHQQHVSLYESDTQAMLGNILNRNDVVAYKTLASDFIASAVHTKELWQKYKLKFEVAGTLYRGESPPVSMGSRCFTNFANRICQCSPRLINIGPFAEEKATVKITISTRGILPVELFSKRISFIRGYVDYAFLEGEGHFQYNTEHSCGLEITCLYSTTTKYCGLIPFPPEGKTEGTKNTQVLTVQLLSDAPEILNCVLNLEYSENLTNYIFKTTRVSNAFRAADDLNKTLHRLPQMVPKVMLRQSHCQFQDHTLSTNYGKESFTWRVVHCRNPPLSAVEVMDSDGNVLATSHTIGSETLPTSKQVIDQNTSMIHNSVIHRSMLITGPRGDWALLRSKWKAFDRKHGKAGEMHVQLFMLNDQDKGFVYLSEIAPHRYEWLTSQGRGSVDLKTGFIQFPSIVVDAAEFICVACSIAVSSILCNPRPPPPSNGEAYPMPSKSPLVDLNSMVFLVNAGLYATMLPRLYHTNIIDGYFCQIPLTYSVSNDDMVEQDEALCKKVDNLWRGDVVNDGPPDQCGGAVGRDSQLSE